ncbi:membrane-spanning 4-domains subfamily A member 15 [Microcaecilia unicolor]|uniref:Membrane-spanning 4-domains subfamily A member 15-like n=1 Tax=Microcaecilia unicolor TaxID=1415580 RepID=A0A6P7XA37_9AMPH|nr:membrane-spanning 4-domains subfamily A member 15-like [Microcaecilia unicolor]
MESSDMKAGTTLTFANSLGTSQPGYSTSRSRCTVVLQKLNKVHPRVLGSLQILVGVLLIGFGIFLAYLTRYLETFTIHSGLPFWGGLIFIISGSLSIAAYRTGYWCLVRSSLWLNTVGALTAASAIIAISADIHLLTGQGFEAVLFDILSLLLTSAVLGFCIAVSASCFGYQAVCHNLFSSRRPEKIYKKISKPTLDTEKSVIVVQGV